MNQYHIRESYSAGINNNTRWDRERGIVFDVELMGTTSDNGFDYTAEAINSVIPYVEKVGSYIDHPKTEKNERSLTERFGQFVGPYINREGKLCAREYHYNKKNPFAESFEWMLEKCPTQIGFSINGEAKGSPGENGRVSVSRIVECHGIDLVDRPATTGGIFAIRESLNRKKQVYPIRESNSTMLPEAFKTGVGELANAITSGSMELADAKKKMSALWKLLEPNGETTTEPNAEETAEAEYVSVEESKKSEKALALAGKSKRAWIRNLANQVETINIREQERVKATERQQTITVRENKAKTKFGTDSDKLLTVAFKEQLANAKDDSEVDSLINDRLSVFNIRENKNTNNTPISSPNAQAKDISVVVNELFGDLNK